ncbi:MAG: hypothetical protein V4719_28170 [Planctomycetota bacterium]
MMFRLPMLRALWSKEWLRLRKQPTALLLLGLLTAVSVLIATGGPQLMRAGDISKLPTCWVVYDSENEWITYLKQHVPEHPPIRMVAGAQMPRRGNAFVYPSGDCGMEISTINRQHPRIIFRYPGTQSSIFWPYTQWFWSETVAFIGETPAFDQVFVPMGRSSPQAPSDVLKQTSLSDLMTIEMVGSLLLYGVQFFCCAHLLISFTSQERERGTLLAMALTPASVAEILLAKCLFHGCLSLTMCGIIVAILRPVALAQPLLWGTLVVSAVGFLAVGIMIASLAKTQATAALLTLCYMLGVALVFHLSRGWAGFAMVRELMFEHRGFLLIYASLKSGASGVAWLRLGGLAVVVLGWATVATQVFRRRGWR